MKDTSLICATQKTAYDHATVQISAASAITQQYWRAPCDAKDEQARAQRNGFGNSDKLLYNMCIKQLRHAAVEQQQNKRQNRDAHVHGTV